MITGCEYRLCTTGIRIESSKEMAVEGTLGAAASMESLSSIEETLDHGDSHDELETDSHDELETDSQTESKLIDDTELQNKTNLSEAKIDYYIIILL